MSHSENQDSNEDAPLAWSAELARSIAGQRQRLKALARGHEMRVENLERALTKAIDAVRAAECPADELEALAPVHHDPLHRVDEAPPDARHQHGNDEDAQSAPHVEVPMDWESHKRRLLEAIETETAEAEMAGYDEPRRLDERLTIDGTIRITDAVVAEKDREIARLTELVQQQEAAAKVALDLHDLPLSTDEVLVRQQKRLQDAEAAFNAKQRVAEVELAQQRARLARQMAELDEGRRAFDAERAQWAAERPDLRASSGTEGPKPQRGRWRARLGLKDNDGSNNAT